MQISETIIIALITFASGALGTVVGAISAQKTAKLSAKNQLQQIVIRENYTARLSAFNELFKAHADFLSSDYDKELEKAFICAVNRACLVASPDIIDELVLFQNGALSRSENRVSKAVTAMHRDLSIFPEPEISQIEQKDVSTPGNNPSRKSRQRKADWRVSKQRNQNNL